MKNDYTGAALRDIARKIKPSENEVKHLLEKAIDNVIAGLICNFITGMAKGTDIWAAEIVLLKRKAE